MNSGGAHAKGVSEHPPAIPIIILATPALAGPVSACPDPLKASLAAIASEPLGTAPLTLRRQAYEAIRTIPGMESVDADFSAFADRARLMSAEPLQDDARMARDLFTIVRSSVADPAAKHAATLSISLLLRAGRHAVLVALADGESVADGPAGSAAERALESARSDYSRAMEWLLRGDACHATRLLASSLQSSLKALSLMGVSYSPDADMEGDGLIDIIELRAGSSPLISDTDSDGMGDYYEVFSLIPYCMPGYADTDGDGTPDGMEDTDEDGFTNMEEMFAGTDPLDADDPGMLLTHEASEPLALGSPGDGLRVLIDLFHGEWDGAAVENMTLPIDIRGLLEENGFIADVNLRSPIDALDLSPYAALLVVSPWLPFTAGELSAIESFVASGGGLLVSCDTQMTTLNQAPNQVAGLFGMRFRSEWYAFESIVAPSYPIMAGLSDGDLFQPFMLFDAAIDQCPANATVLTGGSYVPWPSMVAMGYGAGRVVAGPNNGLCQPWGKGIDADAYYARDVPNVLLIRTVEWLAKGTVTPPPPPEGDDTDYDGLADATEAPGIVDQFGMLLMVDPYTGDTDGDGLWDGDEVGAWNGAYWLTASCPVRNDTDWDYADDFVEWEQGTDPMLRDTDADGLWDGDELYAWGTDPLWWDTDGDGDGDGDEAAWGMDPLLYNERWSMLAATHEFCLGLVAGEFAMDDHGNMPFFSGLLAGGAVSLVPVVGWLAGFLIDARDFLAALSRGDWTGLAVNTLALVPYVGDPADVIGTVARFMARHPEMGASVGIFMSRLDWMKEIDRAACIRYAFGDEAIDGMMKKGFSEGKLLRLSHDCVKLDVVNARLQPLFDQYPGMRKFFEVFGDDAVDDTEAQLYGKTVDLLLKRLGTVREEKAGRILGYFVGGYTQFVMQGERIAEGWKVITRAEKFSARGYDLAAERNGIVRLVEAKSASTNWEQLSNLFRLDDGKLWFNDKYYLQQLEDLSSAQPILDQGKIEIELFINDPGAQRIINYMKQLMNAAPEEQLYAFYKRADQTRVQIPIIFTGVLR
jgi:hypothetical protein